MSISHKCYACGSGAFSCLFLASDYITSDKFDVYICRQCRLVSTVPRLSAAGVKKYYQNSYYGKRKSFVENLLNMRRGQMVLGIVGDYKGGFLIDVGCGNGSFLKKMIEAGWSVAGTEIAPQSHIQASLADKICLGDFNNCDLREKQFDVVTMWHSFEHFHDPLLYLREANRILKQSGILILEIPNFASWQSKLTRSNWFHLDVPRHAFHYSPEVIKLFLEKTAFFVDSISHFSFIEGFFGWIQSILNCFTGRKNFLFDFLNHKITFRDLRFHASDTLLTILLVIPATLFASPLFLLEGIFGKGGVIIVRAKKRAAS